MRRTNIDAHMAFVRPAFFPGGTPEQHGALAAELVIR